MRPLRFRHGNTFSEEEVVEMQERLAALERLSTNQQHQLEEQQAEMLRLRKVLLAVGRASPDFAELPTMPYLAAVSPQTTVTPTPPMSAAADTSPPASSEQADADAGSHIHAQTSRRALLKWGSAAAAAGVAATAASVLREAPTAQAAGTAWATGTVTADAETVVKPGSNYSDNDILQLQQGSGTVLQPAQLKTALAAYDTTGGGIGVYATSAGGTGLYGITDTGTAAQGQAGLYAKAVSTGTGVAGTSGSGIGVQGNSNSGIGGSFTGGLAPLALGLGPAGAPTSGTHIKGEIYADANAMLYVCVQDGTPGTWNKLAIGNAMNFLPAPIRILDTRPGSGAPLGDGSGPWPAESYNYVQVTGTAVGGVSVPAGAKGFFGNVTVTQEQGPGFLRLFPAGGINPNTSTINYVANQNLANACLVGLSSGGGITIYVNNRATHIILDIAGYVF